MPFEVLAVDEPGALDDDRCLLKSLKSPFEMLGKQCCFQREGRSSGRDGLFFAAW